MLEKGNIVLLSRDIIKFFRAFLIQSKEYRSNWPGKSIPTRSKCVRV